MEFKELHSMDPFLFEAFTAQIYSLLGYNVLVTAPTADGGIDVIVDKYDDNLKHWVRTVIQVKRYKTLIGIEKIRELNGILGVHNASFGCLVTTSNYKKGIKAKAKEQFPCISLVGGPELHQLLKTAGMIDSEDNIIFPTNPNLENNRRFALLKIIKKYQATGIQDASLFGLMKSDFHVTVPDGKLSEDVKALEESG